MGNIINKDTIIFSGATYGNRSKLIHITLSLLLSNPTLPKNRHIIINVPSKDINNLHTELIDDEIEIHEVKEDLYSFNKFYYAVQKYSDHWICTFDDDMNYSCADLTTRLSLCNKNYILAGHMHPFYNYRYNYEINYEESVSKTYKDVIAPGSHMVCYPPHSLDKTLYHAKYISQKTKQDDIYLRYCTKNYEVCMPSRSWNSNNNITVLYNISNAERGLSFNRSNNYEIIDLGKNKFIFSDIIENIENANDIDYVILYNDNNSLDNFIITIKDKFNFIKNIIPIKTDNKEVNNDILNEIINTQNISPRFLLSTDNIEINYDNLCEDDFYCGNFIRYNENVDIIPYVTRYVKTSIDKQYNIIEYMNALNLIIPSDLYNNKNGKN